MTDPDDGSMPVLLISHGRQLLHERIGVEEHCLRDVSQNILVQRLRTNLFARDIAGEKIRRIPVAQNSNALLGFDIGWEQVSHPVYSMAFSRESPSFKPMAHQAMDKNNTFDQNLACQIIIRLNQKLILNFSIFLIHNDLKAINWFDSSRCDTG